MQTSWLHEYKWAITFAPRGRATTVVESLQRSSDHRTAGFQPPYGSFASSIILLTHGVVLTTKVKGNCRNFKKGPNEGELFYCKNPVIFVLMELKDIGHWRIVLPERVVTLGDDHILQSSINHHETLTTNINTSNAKVVDKLSFLQCRD